MLIKIKEKKWVPMSALVLAKAIRGNNPALSDDRQLPRLPCAVKQKAKFWLLDDASSFANYMKEGRKV